MTRGELLAGLLLFLAVVGGCGVAALVMVRGPWSAARAAGVGIVWSALLVGAHLVPLALGVLSRGSVLAAAALLCVAAVASRRRAHVDPLPAASEPRRSPWLAVAGGVLLAGCALASVRATAGLPFTGLDAQNFQIPVPARWLQTGSLWQLAQFTPDYSNATYPHTGNVVLLAAILPWRSAFAAGLATVPFYGLALVATYGAARELRAPAGAAALAALTLGAVPIVSRTGLQGAMSDGPMLAWLAAGVLFLLRHARGGRASDLVLAGAGLGLAFGAKWYAVAAVPVIVAAWALARRRPAEWLKLAGLTGAVGGVWLVRNWVETGNPLFPQSAAGLFPAPPDPFRETAGWTLAHYATDFEVWRTYLRPAFAAFLGAPGLALVVGTVVAAGLAARDRARAAAAGVAVAVTLAVVYVFTPYSALGAEGAPTDAGVSTRYALPALLAAALLLGWALGRLRGAWLVAAQLGLAVAFVDGLRRGFGGLPLGHVAAGCAVAGVLAAAGVAWRGGIQGVTGAAGTASGRGDELGVSGAAGAGGAEHVVGRRALVAAGIAAMVAVVVLGAGAEALRVRAAGTTGYGASEPPLAAVAAQPPGTRVGLAGLWSNDGPSPVLASFGPRLRNHVAYVGPFRDGMLRRHTTAAAFVAALDRGGYDLILVGRGLAPAPSPGALAREETWALAAGWRLESASRRLALLRRPG